MVTDCGIILQTIIKFQNFLVFIKIVGRFSMLHISEGPCNTFIILLHIESYSITMICQGIKLLFGFSLFIGQVILVLIMSAEIPVKFVTILGTAALLDNIGSMTFSTNVFNVQLIE